MGERKFVAYFRVSTQRQGRSGLGLEAQRAAILNYLNGGAWNLIEEFTEIESGKINERPQLQRALAACRLHGATLVIAKLDRLSRNAAFLLNLQEAGVRFVAADMPNANQLTVGIMALVAQQEREAISARTKAALAAAKARGVILGTPRNLKNQHLGAKRSAAVRMKNAINRAADLKAVINELRASGCNSLRMLSQGLNERSIPAPKGGKWSATQVARVVRFLTARAL